MEPPLQKQLDRQLGLASVFSIAVGAMLGSGIFVLPGMATAIAGPWVSLSYLLAGLMVFPALLSKAELATAMPVSGGSYVYVDRSMGPLMGTVAGLGTWFSLAAKTAFALAGLGAYLAIFSSMNPMHFALAVLALMVALNMLGAGKVSGLQVGVVVFSLLALAFFVAAGFPAANMQMFEPPFPHGETGVIEGAAFVFVSYAGVTKVCSVAEEVRHPGVAIPRGMIAAQLTVMVLYGLVATVIVGNVEMGVLARDVTPVATAAGAFLGRPGRLAFAIVAVIGLLSMCNAGVLSSTRYPFAMGRDHLLPPALQRIDPRLGTPVRAIALTAVLLVVLLVGLPVVKLAKLASAFTIFLFCIDNVALILLRETATEWYKPEFRAPFYPWLQIVGLVGGSWLLFELGWISLVGVGGAVVLGTAWYWVYARRHVVRQGVFRHIWGWSLLQQTAVNEARDEAQADRPRVIVPLMRAQEDSTTLMHLGAAFVDEGGVLEVVRLEEVPDQTMLMYFEEQDDRMRQLERESEAVAEDLHVEVDFRDVITHNARQAVAHHAKLVHADWIVMAWPERPAFERLIPNPMSWWLDHPPCDLAVFRPAPHGRARAETGLARFRRLLVLAIPGPYDTMVVHMADRLARRCGGRLTLLMPVPVDERAETMRAHTEYHRQFIRLCDSPAESLVLRTADPDGAIIELSSEYDLLVLGAPPEAPLRNLLWGSPELALLVKARCAVLRLKAPRHRIHGHFRAPTVSGRLDQDLEPLLRHAALAPRLRATSKRDLFAQVARQLATIEDTDLEPAIERALWEREERQSTNLGGGMALTGVTLPGVQAPTLGVFTTAAPLDLGTPRSEPVQVVVVILACPADRQTQLWLKDLFLRLLLDGWLREQLPQARNQANMLHTLRSALRRYAKSAAPPPVLPVELDEEVPMTEEIPKPEPDSEG